VPFKSPGATQPKALFKIIRTIGTTIIS